MKYFAYLATMILLISIAALFYLQRPDGETWLNSEGIGSTSNNIKEQMVALSSGALDHAVDAVVKTSNQVVEKISGDSTEKATTIYKWQDKSGQWHYSDQPNPDGKSERLVLDPKDITVIAAEDTSILKGSAKAGNLTLPKSSNSVYDPVVIKKLFDDAEQIKTKLEQRTQALESNN
ncbi:DUF4124 domain-containing protein [Pseudoalteromonas porphyrae]|uniref:DUF4124 domain-containing protein n=1 Tax=Pseudoalteromonas porphyrae TaxID=187330 RepID=A0A0N1MW32_9GAMM|nr:DUF4124 domain-containing protein [Pseudoalteromonas porphyrae]KPH65287.1 hypothetical protein ADS77_03195 [Pseudoalteromonas porphyrae]